MLLPAFAALVSAVLPLEVTARWNAVPNPAQFPDLENVPESGPNPPPDYMVSNQFNLFGAAPDKGTQNGPVWGEFGGYQGYLRSLQSNFSRTIFDNGNISIEATDGASPIPEDGYDKRQSSGFWLTQLGPLGKAPMVDQSGYKFYRNVKDYGAKGDGSTDDTTAINAAISDGNRCGMECGNTFAMGAIIYFPPGTYKVCTPIIQLYYTQFIGDPNNRPVIKGCSTFKGIGLIDTDVYIPGMNGSQWYINQNQFFRQIRNFEFDLRDMPLKTDDEGQPLVPTGIHWQVSQATSLQNLKFTMPTGKNASHVGIFTENGSGGFVSDLEFNGGNIGWRVGNQQYTARGLKFNGCTTAVQMIWDWGFNWQQVEVTGGAIAFNITGKGGDTGQEEQGTGSVSIIDSKFSNVPIGILTSERTEMRPSIVIDNLELSGVGIAVKSEQGNTLLAGGSTMVKLWAAGRRYKAGTGSYVAGAVQGAPSRPDGLLSGGKLFVRSRPQYESLGAGSFLVATQAPYSLSNDGTGDQTDGLNKFLTDAASAGKVAYFPAGIYLAAGTVKVPPGSKLQGSSWSQIMCTGSYFNDMKNPKVFIQVGDKGQKGKVEIVEMMFTAKGPTAGAIMVEWNIESDSPGAAGMWDTHVRVGGSRGSDLDFTNCPKKSTNYDKCTTTSMLLHITSQASGYFENMWTWVADHDNDRPIYMLPDSSSTQVSLFAARGILIESTKPTWLYGTGSEHAILYQYQLYKAKNVYLGHIQTEAPYFQPVPAAPEPFTSALGVFPGDPTFKDCTTPTCKMAWGLRVVDSSDILFHTMGLYSWFNGYQQYCVKREDCQQKILDIKGKADRIAMYNLFSKATLEIGSGGRGNTIYRNDSNQNGYTAEVSVWFPGDGTDDADVVYLGPEVYKNRTATCMPPCIFVLPPSTLPSPTTISIPPYTTPIEVGHSEGGTFVVTTTTITVYAPNITTDKMPMSNVNVSAIAGRGGHPTGSGSGSTGGTSSSTPGASPSFYPDPSIDIPPVPVIVTPGGSGGPTTRWITLPPWPKVNEGPPPATSGGINVTGSWDFGPTTTGDPQSTPTADHPDDDESWGFDGMVFPCPPGGILTLDDFRATILLDNCQGAVTLGLPCTPTKTKEMDAPASVTLNLGCVLYTGTQTPVPVVFPPIGLIPIPTPVPEGEDEDPVYISCKTWFFFICIDWPEIKIYGWKFPPLPKGIYKGGPPGIDWPKIPGITIKGELPPWPPLTIPEKGPVPTPEKPSNCKTQTAEICMTRTSGAGVVEGGTTRTTSVTTTETCATIYGCKVEDESTSTETFAACTIIRAAKARDAAATATPKLEARAPPQPQCILGDAIIFPSDPENVDAIRNYLRVTLDPATLTPFRMTEVGSPMAGFTAFFHIIGFNQQLVDNLSQNKASFGIDDVYIISERLRDRYTQVVMPVKAGTQAPVNPDIWAGIPNLPFTPGQAQPQVQPRGPPVRPRAPIPPLPWPEADEAGHESSNHTSIVFKRESSKSSWWAASQLCHPPGQTWLGNPMVATRDASGQVQFKYYYHKSAGANQYVYNMEADFNKAHPDFGKNALRMPETLVWGGEQSGGRSVLAVGFDHGDGTSGMIVGKSLGTAKDAFMVVPLKMIHGLQPPQAIPAEQKRSWSSMHTMFELYLEQYIRVMEDVLNPQLDKKGRTILSVSNGIFLDISPESPALVRMLYKTIKKLGTYGVLVVASVHNEYGHDEDRHDKAYANGRGNDITNFPVAWADPSRADYLNNVLAVGAVDMSQRVASFTPYQQWVTYAPGDLVDVARYSHPQKYLKRSGSSYATPLVAGVAAYLRSLPSKWQTDLQDPRKLKALIKLLERELDPTGIRTQTLPAGKFADPVKTAWSGQLFDQNCLLDTAEARPDGSTVSFTLDLICPDINDINAPGSDKVAHPGSGRGGAIQAEPGKPGPLCNAGGGGGGGAKIRKRADTCGKRCEGFYCVPNPVGHPPDYYDPEDPAHKSTTVPPLPSLTATAGPGDCPKTTSRQCVGSGGGQTCQDVTICAPSKPSTTPTATPSPVCDDACKDKQKLDKGNECRCTRNGCDANSPSCCAKSTCTPCRCDGSGCDSNSPACCGSGTCKWDLPQWTSGKPNWGTCRIHIREWNWFAMVPSTNPVLMEVTSYMNDVQRAYASANTDFGQTMTWYAASSTFPTNIQIELAKKSGALKKRDTPPPGSISDNKRLFESFDLYFTAGNTKWSSGNQDESKLPFCRVGGWDESMQVIDGIPQSVEPNRQMDCYWTCG